MELSALEMRLIVQGMIILILSIAVHEFGHAIIAHKFGDRLPASQGRVTLNPLAHADPIGTLVFPLVGLAFTGGAGFGFGWGRPVQVQPVQFRFKNWSMRTLHMLVAAAGPLMNLLFGVVIAVVNLILIRTGILEPTHALNEALRYAVLLNFILMFFNFIPAPPLDGGTVLAGMLPNRYLPTYEKLAVYGPFVLMAVIFIPGLSRIFIEPAVFLGKTLFGLLGLR